MSKLSDNVMSEIKEMQSEVNYWLNQLTDILGNTDYRLKLDTKMVFNNKEELIKSNAELDVIIY